MLLRGDARAIPLGDETVQTVVTSPPYWGLRDYGLEPSVWGDPIRDRKGGEQCSHEGDDTLPAAESYSGKNRWQAGYVGDGRPNERGPDYQRQLRQSGELAKDNVNHGCWCQKCGAWRGVLGLEPTPELYVQHLVEIFREVRRVLRGDGTLWLNLGDSYNSNPSWGRGHSMLPGRPQENIPHKPSAGWLTHARTAMLKSKDLVGIPWRVAFALQADGWYLRSDIIWAKPNPMPESVRDRPTKAHEYIFLLTKSVRYYFNQNAVAEPSRELDDPRSQRARNKGYSWPKGWDASKGEGGHGLFHRLGREGQNSRMHQDRDPQHSQERKARSGNKQRRIADGKDRMRLNSHLGSSVPWEGTTRNIRTVWTIATQPYAGAHFATFPEAIPERCILAGSRPGDLVLDPFGGSGTVGRVAERLNRRWVCMDLKYQDLSRERTRRVQKELPLSGGRG